ncbi:MAG: M15 family metallopeptidase, partial [Pseudomonadota bacterium]
LEAQAALYAAAPDPTFVSNPETGAIPHCRGAAVDLTLIERATETVLDMGAGFDEFTTRSWHGDLSISPEAQRNRALLLGLMSAAGWDFYAKEWWHYQLFAPRRLPALRDGILAKPLYKESV